MSTINRKWIIAAILLLALVILLLGTWLIAQLFFTPAQAWPRGMMGRGGLEDRWNENRSFTTNGERIYYTGTSRTGPPVTYETNDGFAMPMMGGRMACVDCHGENGEGGTFRMMMTTFEVPNIQYDHLTEEEHGEEEEGEEHPPYTDETLKQAITEGVNPAGEPMEWPMPVWNMSDEQLNDLIDFIKTLR